MKLVFLCISCCCYVQVDMKRVIRVRFAETEVDCPVIGKRNPYALPAKEALPPTCDVQLKNQKHQSMHFIRNFVQMLMVVSTRIHRRNRTLQKQIDLLESRATHAILLNLMI